jgi:hypothetical protein
MKFLKVTKIFICVKMVFNEFLSGNHYIFRVFKGKRNGFPVTVNCYSS